jgi:hypothetical protein
MPKPKDSNYEERKEKLFVKLAKYHRGLLG